MFYVYAIESVNHDFVYVGMTEDLEARIDRHNKKLNISTKYYAPFNLIYSEECVTGAEARKREKFLKSGAGRSFLKQFR